jgi:hypothetical protein
MARHPTKVTPKPNATTYGTETAGNQSGCFGVQVGMDEIERAAIRDEGYDPDNPAVLAALDQVRAELAALKTG